MRTYLPLAADRMQVNQFQSKSNLSLPPPNEQCQFLGNLECIFSSIGALQLQIIHLKPDAHCCLISKLSQPDLCLTVYAVREGGRERQHTCKFSYASLACKLISYN